MKREQYKLYDGQVLLEFDPNKHQYFVDGEQVDGCTGILGVLNKPALIPWAVGVCVDFVSKNLKPYSF